MEATKTAETYSERLRRLIEETKRDIPQSDKLFNRIRQIENMHQCEFDIAVERTELFFRAMREQFESYASQQSEAKDKTTKGPEAYIFDEVFADNGEHSHWRLIDRNTGENLWSEYPEECRAMGYPVSKDKTIEEQAKRIKELEEALKLINDSIEFVETEHNANYVITTEDKVVIKKALNLP